MFQSIVNVFNNSSNVWNIEHLQKILKIPQDQLKILENIPGWTSSEKEKFEDKITGSFNKKSKQKTAKNSQNPKKVKSKKFDSDFLSNISFSNLKTKEIFLTHDKTPLDTDKSCPDNRNKFSIVRSLSLSSLNKLSISNNKVLKRSFSTSTLNTDFSFDSDSDNSKNMSSIIHPVFKGSSNILPLSNSQNFSLTTITADKEEEEKSQFVNSAVQCQMSQCSQPELENNDCATGIRIVKSQSESSGLMINASCNELNFELENKSDVEVSLRKPIVDTDISVNGLNTHSQKLIETSKSKGDTPKLHATDDENFISQPIPCAQPSTSASKDILFSSIQDKNVSSEISHIPDTIEKVGAEDISEKKVNAVKRKRKNKQEKLPKKFCAMKANEIKILYSFDQIGDMIKAIKLLTHV